MSKSNLVNTLVKSIASGGAFKASKPDQIHRKSRSKAPQYESKLQFKKRTPAEKVAREIGKMFDEKGITKELKKIGVNTTKPTVAKATTGTQVRSIRQRAVANWRHLLKVVKKTGVIRPVSHIKKEEEEWVAEPFYESKEQHKMSKSRSFSDIPMLTRKNLADLGVDVEPALESTTHHKGRTRIPRRGETRHIATEPGIEPIQVDPDFIPSRMSGSGMVVVRPLPKKQYRA